jgi:quinolinate synthase
LLHTVEQYGSEDWLTGNIYPIIQDSVPRFEWEMYVPLIAEINRLKREKNAVILGHNYMVPEIFHGISDYKGDSLGLSEEARNTDADIIVFCGVHFMAETAKILNPHRMVLIPDLDAGCSLSESITAADVRLLKERYPGVPIVTYMNTPADIKAESDIVCTSANAVSVVESMGTDRVIFLPDEYLARNVAAQTDVDVITWHGTCIVQADFVGSTTGMIGYLDRARSNHVILVTECSMSDNVQAAHPDLEFVKPCTLCPHMKKITLEKTLISLQELKYEVDVPEDIRERAWQALDRMLAVKRDKVAT